MKIFKLKSVEYKNLMAVGSELIKIDLEAHHKSLVTGVNGGGKSTIIEAITYALFGKPFRDIKLAQLINSVSKKDLWVKLVMEYNNDTFTIIRGQKPTIFEIYKNDEMMPALAGVKEFQAQFEELIGMNYNSYKQVVVLGTAGYTPFMDLKAPDRRKMVEDLLNVSMLADMDKSNKEELKAINLELSKLDLQISHQQTQIKTVEDADARQKKLSGDNVTRLETMMETELSAIDGIKAGNMVLNEQILLVELPEPVSDELQQARSKKSSILTQQTPLQNVLYLYNQGGECPTCRQSLNDRSSIGDIETNLTALKKEFADMDSVILDLSKKQTAYEEAKKQINAIENQIATNKQVAIKHIERAKQIRGALAEAKKEFVDNTEQLKTLSNELNIMIQSKNDLLIEKTRRMVIVGMLKDSGIKANIFKKYIPIFNKQINHYLELLEADYSFTLNEEFTETIKSRGRENFTYSSFSQGEKGRIDLALMFTWRDIAEKISGIRISCLILDEVFDSALDTNGSKNISSVLNTMKDSNIFIISHRDHDPEDYGQHIRMKKVGRFTVME